VSVKAPILDQQAVTEMLSELKPLMQEVGEKNHVQVIVVRADEGGKRWGSIKPELVHDSHTDKGASMAFLPMLARVDRLRMLAGKKPRFLDEAIRLTGGELVSVTENLRTTVGIDYVASALGDSSGSRAAVAQYIALSNCTGTPAAGDTSATTGASGTGINWGTANATDAAAATSRGEYTALGLARALATYAHTGSATNYTMTKQFTASSTITAVQACGLFNNSSQGAGTLFVENTFTATSLATNDQLTITWTINI
jgi:hypothetical protein